MNNSQGNGSKYDMKTGKVPENVLKRSVLRQIKTRRDETISGAGIGKDCAIFAGEGCLVTCVQEAPVMAADAVGGSNEPEAFITMAELIQKCANNLAVGGAEPMAVMVALLLPAGAEEADIKALMAEAEEKCGELSIEIAGGQTRVTGAVTEPVAVVTGYGRILEESGCAIGAAAPGQDIVVSKWIGLQGTAIVAKRNRARLLERYPAYFVEEATRFNRYLSILPEATVVRKAAVCAMHDASEGGIFGALWELAEGAGVGLTVDLRKLPLRQETVEVCECCGLNPYELQSGGCLIMTAADGSALVAVLGAAHIPATIVGKVTDSNDRILICGDEVRYMERPRQDGVYINGV